MDKCNRDCSRCPFPDCVVDDVSPEEAAAVKERDRKAKNGDVCDARIERKQVRSRRWREAHPEQQRDCCRSYYARNRDVQKQKALDYYYTRTGRKDLLIPESTNAA